MAYVGYYHKLVAQMDMGIYNWKQHSTGYLLKLFRHAKPFHGWEHEHTWWKMEEDEVTKHKHEVYWYTEWRVRLQDELNKRPHLSTKRERKHMK